MTPAQDPEYKYLHISKNFTLDATLYWEKLLGEVFSRRIFGSPPPGHATATQSIHSHSFGRRNCFQYTRLLQFSRTRTILVIFEARGNQNYLLESRWKYAVIRPS